MRKTAAIGWAMLLLCSACEDRLEEAYAPAEVKPITQPLTLQQFNAQFEEASTRTQLEGRNVLWTAGDNIRVYGSGENGSYHAEVFTTEETGPNATFKGSSIQTYDNFYAFYPSEQIKQLTILKDDEWKDLYAVNMIIPSTQVTVPDGIGNQLNLSYAKSATNDSKDFFFHNICSLIKFKVSGTGVNSLKRVRLTANNDADDQTVVLSGDVFITLDNGTIQAIEGDNYVEIMGDFDDSHTYYILCAPTAMANGFTLSLFNDEGMECTKKGVNAVTLHTSEILNLGTIQVDDNDYTNGWAMQYLSNNSNHPVSWVIIPEGFTQEQMNDYHTLASEMLDFIFDVEPFKQYKSYFNVHILDAVSEEQGADDTTRNLYVNTAFDAGWSTYHYSNMRSNRQRVFEFVEAHNPDILAGKVSINETSIIMLINDTRYGGICWYWKNGKTFAMVPTSTDSDGSSILKWSGNGGSQVTCKGTWLNIALHEGGGHMFGKLADEYVGSATYNGTTIPTHEWPVPFGLNITADKENNLLWRDFIPNEKGTKQVGKFLHVGTYEGGYASYGKGIWRSEEVSCMDDNRSYFSAWQRYLIAKRIHDLAQEPFTYDDFIADDSQYNDIQAGVQYAGTEGIITTIFEPGIIRYNSTQASSLSLRSKSIDNIMPPLPPPVLMDEE